MEPIRNSWISLVDLDERHYAPGVLQPAHRHDFASVTLLVRGTLAEASEGRREEASALSVVVKPPGVAHETHFGSAEASTVRLVVAPRAFTASPVLRAALGEWRWIHGGPAASGLLGLLVARRNGRLSRTAFRTGVSRVIAAVAAERRNPAAPAPAWLCEAREAIERGSSGSVRTAALSRRARVHPVYLARTFRRHYGCSVGALIRRRRVIAAARLVADSGATLVDIAYEAGFSDQAHFCREFRLLAGTTPLAFRRLAHAG